MVAFGCVVIYLAVLMILMACTGQFEKPPRKLSFGKGAVVAIIGGGFPTLLWFLYDHHYEFLESVFIAIIFIGIIIYAFCVVFFGKR